MIVCFRSAEDGLEIHIRLDRASLKMILRIFVSLAGILASMGVAPELVHLLGKW